MTDGGGQGRRERGKEGGEEEGTREEGGEERGRKGGKEDGMGGEIFAAPLTTPPPPCGWVTANTNAEGSGQELSLGWDPTGSEGCFGPPHQLARFFCSAFIFCGEGYTRYPSI